MKRKTSLIVILGIMAVPAYAADAPDFDTFYSLYKTAATQNDITITSDITATRLVTAPGAQTTIIDGGGFDFNGGGFNGFTVSSGYNFTLINGGVSASNTSFNNFNRPQGGVFANLGGNVTTSNSVFANNTSNYGGSVIYQNNNATFSAQNVTFDANQVTHGDGGVIYNEYETIATFDGATFQNNTAPNGYGGVAFNDGTLNISNSVFTSNSSSGGGGALYNSNTMNLTNVRFVGNNATDTAGAIYSTGAMNLTGGTFENNTGDTGGAIGNYGIIGDTLYAAVSDSYFKGNSATYGGAVYNWDDMYIIDSSFENNSATDNGGAIFNLAQLYLIANNADINFNGNTVAGQSNAIHSTDMLNINAGASRSVTFNDAITGGGEIIINRPYIYDAQNVPTGGAVVLNADMSGFAGNVTIYNGDVTLSDNGRFFTTSDLNVLGGTLDLGAASVSVTNAAFAPGVTLQLSVTDATAYGNVTANNFSISDGANLSVILSPNALGDANNIRVQLLRSENEIADNFSPNINNNIYEFLKLGDGWYEISAGDSFADVIANNGGTQNNVRTAAAWQLEPDTPGSLAHTLYLRMNTLLQTDAIGYIRALSALAPSSAPLTHIVSNTNVLRFDAMINDATKYNIGGLNVWATGFGGGGKLGASQQYADFDMYGFGGGVGAEYTDGNWTFGAAYAYQYDRLKSWARTIHVPTHGGGVYAKYSPDNFVIRMAGAAFFSDWGETKNVAGLQLDSSLNMTTFSAWGDVGYDFARASWHLLPRAGVRYMAVHRDDTADDAGQSIAAADLDFLTAYANMSVTRGNWYLAGVELTPSVTIGASYDMHTKADDLYVNVNDATYVIIGTTLPRFAFDTELKLGAQFNEFTQIDFGISAHFRVDYINYTGRIRARLRF